MYIYIYIYIHVYIYIYIYTYISDLTAHLSSDLFLAKTCYLGPKSIGDLLILVEYHTFIRIRIGLSLRADMPGCGREPMGTERVVECCDMCCTGRGSATNKHFQDGLANRGNY